MSASTKGSETRVRAYFLRVSIFVLGPPSSTPHSGHFRHKTAEIWDPHPEYELVAFGKKFHLNLVHNDDVPKNIHVRVAVKKTRRISTINRG